MDYNTIIHLCIIVLVINKAFNEQRLRKLRDEVNSLRDTREELLIERAEKIEGILRSIVSPPKTMRQHVTSTCNEDWKDDNKK